jgi:transcriptional regulator with XRE-family HTH domain
MSNGNVKTIQSSWQTSLQEFGELLRQRRQQVLHLSQGEMASRIGIDQSRISRIERGIGTPKDKGTAKAYAEGYRLNREETEIWFELLFGPAIYFQLADDRRDTPWGRQIEQTYSLLEQIQELLRCQTGSCFYDYFASLRCDQLDSRVNGLNGKLSTAITWLLAEKRRLPRNHLLVELSGSVMHYLNVRGRYQTRLTLAIAAAQAAQELERKTIEGWLRGDAIPWTLMEHYRDPVAARRHLDRALILAGELKNKDMEALALAFMAQSFLLQANITQALVYLQQASCISCSPAVQTRIYWIAGDVALAQRQFESAIRYFEQAKKADMEFARGRQIAVTPHFRLGRTYLELGELPLAREAFAAVLSNDSLPLSPPRMAHAKLGLAQTAKLAGDLSLAREYAREADFALRTADHHLPYKKTVRRFWMELPA